MKKYIFSVSQKLYFCSTFQHNASKVHFWFQNSRFKKIIAKLKFVTFIKKKLIFTWKKIIKLKYFSTIKILKFNFGLKIHTCWPNKKFQYLNQKIYFGTLWGLNLSRFPLQMRFDRRGYRYIRRGGKVYTKCYMNAVSCF